LFKIERVNLKIQRKTPKYPTWGIGQINDAVSAQENITKQFKIRT
jgi:hypothetical protein